MITEKHLYQSVWLYAGAGAMLLLASGMFLGTIGIDDEIHFADTSFDGIGRGLWGSQFITYLLPGQLGISFAPMFVGILLYATSTTILIRFWGLKDQIIANCAALIIGSFPYFASMMTFDVAQVAYPLGFLCIILSLYPVFEKPTIVHYFVGIFLFAFAFSLYQGVASTLVTAFISTAGMRLALAEDKEKMMNLILAKFIPRFLFLGVSGSVSYLALTKLFQAIFTHRDWGTSHDVSLSLSFLDPQQFRYIIESILGLITGWNYDLPGLSVALFFILIIVLSAVIFLLTEFALWKKIFLCIVLWLSTCLAPFWILFVQSAGLSPRSTVGLGLIYAFLFASLATVSKNLTRKLLIGIASIWCFQFIFLGNEMYYTQHFTYLADRDTANRIVNRVDSLSGIEQLPYPVPVTLTGAYDHPENGLKSFSVLGASIFGWDRGNIARQILLFKHINIDGLQLLSEVEIRSVLNEYVDKNGIPSWPQAGSVFLYDGKIVVVNLGDQANRTGRVLKRPVAKLRDFLL